MPLGVITGLACMAGGAALLAMWRAVRARLSPEKREQRRRLDINLNGRLGDALLTECDENTLYYTYQVRGVHYTASQDISALRDHLPGAPERLGGMVNMTSPSWGFSLAESGMNNPLAVFSALSSIRLTTMRS